MYETKIVIKFSNGDFLRVPFYVWQKNNLIETTPSIVDFGMVQMNSAPMRIRLAMRIHPYKVKRIVDYQLPLDQENLDFKLLKPKAYAEQ